ncbi:MAG: valine--tRNA ligase [Cyclobacteriaceae bacterium]|nr:valine--tRNA ligase [Cyclobacteriaceae bacterium]
MTLSTKYNPKEVEDKWYQDWMDKGYFKSSPNPDKEPYTIVIPPPNVTGVLHMGHMLNNTLQDVLIRRARMQGKEALWVPGTDHASIATEAKVVAMLKEKGIDKKDISREEFLEYAWEWKEKYGGIILEQLKKLGASCDWDRTRFTMDEDLSKSVNHVFVDLYNKGYIYRGIRMVNWDPQGKTALADDEVIHKEVNSKLYHVRYKIKGEDEYVTVATTRPETILGDTAVCVNPLDERYSSLKGKTVLVPLLNREVPIIQDEYVAMDFGTGCLKVTPAHDINDYELGLKYNLESIDILNDDGTLSEAAQLFVGEDRFVVRKKIVKQLEEEGHLVKVEEYVNNVGFSERTDAVVEPKLSTQWFVKMQDLTKRAYTSVMEDEVQLVPPKFKNMYRHWMENVRDWCISRQLWWGHQIPAWYLPTGKIVVAETEEDALKQAQAIDASLTLDKLTRDEDVLDTWFSSGLWPISVFNGIMEPDNEDINYYYPTNDLITAPEILFFWVARMIMFGYEYRNERPFNNVYLTGIVRDKQGRKMSKSLGNSPDPIELMEKYGADGVRTGMLFSSPAGNDLLFDEKLCEQGRNFSNKIWNAFRLVHGWEIDSSLDGKQNQTSLDWFESRFNSALAEIEDHFSKFRISDALMTTYKLVWNDFCSWYLEMIKPEFGKPIDQSTYDATVVFFEKVLKVLHPFMPFISEEIWHLLRDRRDSESLMVAEWPKVGSVDSSLLEGAEASFEVITQVRNLRNSKGISPKETLALQYKSESPLDFVGFEEVVSKLANLSELVAVDAKPETAFGFVIKGHEYFVPVQGGVDLEKEREEILKELDYTKGFMNSVSKKLSNERFVNNAPEQVVANERKKLADAESKIKALEEQLEAMGS